MEPHGRDDSDFQYMGVPNLLVIIDDYNFVEQIFFSSQILGIF